ncbi:TAXI family TRAP transporter solute-binding subunit [Methylibium sp.]|uniref:TAXI family TRAP transporter solute-binding subunit n=1 Tax=Methylibium sp. TaxID=2067992 RepID=UPI00179F2439|nr:TAXI family TRAP transporter solute-binding subunit [Methylibium sp.]MBA3589273.1 TAXI family TRAP transporter solute-binding subunit [Methylibium sp.]
MNLLLPITPAQAARRRLLRALAVTPALGIASAWAGDAPLRLGTSTPGGRFALYGQALEGVLNARAGRTLLTAVGTKGTNENLQGLASGELDIALIQGTSANQVLQTQGDAGLRVLYAMYPSPGMLAVPGDSTARRLEDLKGQPVVFGVPASGLVLLARQVFGGLGLDIDRDFRALYVEQAAQSPQRVLDGEAAGLWGAGVGWPGFTRLAEAPRGASFIGPSPAQIPQILQAQPFLKAMEVPAGAYAGLEHALPTVGSWNVMLTKATFSEERAYQLARALHEAAAALAAALPQAAMSTARLTAQATPSPALLHSGTARLLRELGLLPG